jgi:hypothetical protein
MLIMATPKHKTQLPREKPAAFTEPVVHEESALLADSDDGEWIRRQGSWISLIAWFLAFLFLTVLVLWDFVAGLFFRT